MKIAEESLSPNAISAIRFTLAAAVFLPGVLQSWVPRVLGFTISKLKMIRQQLLFCSIVSLLSC